MSKTFTAAIFRSFFLFLAVAFQSSQAQSSSSQDVRVNNFPETQQIKGDVQVTNFPDTQQVKGSVSIEGTMSHARYDKREGILVPSSRRTELSELVHAGNIETHGFTTITVCLQGEVRSDSFEAGTIGVVLVPDEAPIMRLLRDSKRIQFPIESVARLKTGDPVFFDAEVVQRSVPFPRYRIYLYNTLNKTAEANVYFHLTN